jgi:hypothetical protein
MKDNKNIAKGAEWLKDYIKNKISKLEFLIITQLIKMIDTVLADITIHDGILKEGYSHWESNRLFNGHFFISINSKEIY